MKKALVVVFMASLAFATTITRTLESGKKQVVTFGRPTVIRIEKGCTYITGYLGEWPDGAIQTLKIDEEDIVVEKTYEGNYAEDAIYAQTTDEADNTYVTCYSFNGRDNDYRTIKYDPEGNVLWNRVYDGSSIDIAQDITVDELGNVYITGLTGYWGEETASDILTIKYNSKGKLLWKKAYDSGKYDTGPHVRVDASGYVYVKCYSEDEGFHTVKYNKYGRVQ